MILRRIATAIRAQDWSLVILEILIVVIGIFLGLQETQWNQARIDRADEESFLRALHQDVVEMGRITARSQNIRVTAFSHLEQAANILFGLAPERPLTQPECDAISSSHVTGVIPTSLPSLTALRDAGRTHVLRDVTLLAELARLTQRQEALDTSRRLSS